jgi:hypothetical protein
MQTNKINRATMYILKELKKGSGSMPLHKPPDTEKYYSLRLIKL